MTAGSLSWCAKPLLGGWRGERMRWSHVMRRDRLSGVWMPSLRRLKKWASRLNAARSAASACEKEYDGGGRTVGGQVPTKILSAIGPAVVYHSTQPPQGSTTICTDETLASSAPHFPASPGLVPNRAPYQGGAGLQSRTGENLGVWSAARARWQGTDPM